MQRVVQTWSWEIVVPSSQGPPKGESGCALGHARATTGTTQSFREHVKEGGLSIPAAQRRVSGEGVWPSAQRATQLLLLGTSAPPSIPTQGPLGCAFGTNGPLQSCGKHWPTEKRPLAWHVTTPTAWGSRKCALQLNSHVSPVLPVQALEEVPSWSLWAIAYGVHPRGAQEAGAKSPSAPQETVPDCALSVPATLNPSSQVKEQTESTCASQPSDLLE